MAHKAPIAARGAAGVHVVRDERSSLKQFVRRLLARAVARLPVGILTDRAHFDIYERRGVHITPAHFYSPAPTLSELDESVWSAKSGMIGVDMNLAGQIATLEAFSEAGLIDEFYRWDSETRSTDAVYAAMSAFGGSDGAMYWSMIRTLKPNRIIEIGAGRSTLIAAGAIERNGAPCDLTAIEPYPAPWLGRVADVVVSPVERLGLDRFADLQAGDILFIDSSHTVRVGGDVVFEFCEILPRLKPGVMAHIHDIALPFNYPRRWIMEDHRFWAEQYLLQAFLAFNPAFHVRWCFSCMQEERPDLLSRHFKSFAPGKDSAGSFWMERAH